MPFDVDSYGVFLNFRFVPLGLNEMDTMSLVENETDISVNTPHTQQLPFSLPAGYSAPRGALFTSAIYVIHDRILWAIMMTAIALTLTIMNRRVKKLRESSFSCSV